MSKPPTVVVDPEFRAYIDPLSPEELAQLEESLVTDGCMDALRLWNGIVVDGHHRHDICTRLDMEFDTVDVDLPDREAAFDWMDRNQLGRRNLTADQFTLRLGRRYNRAKKNQGGDQKSNGQNVRLNVAKDLAAEHRVNEKTVRRAGKFAEEVDDTPELQQAVRDKKPVAKAKKEMKAKEREDEREEAAKAAPKSGRKALSMCKLHVSTAAELEMGDSVAIVTDPPYGKDYRSAYVQLTALAGGLPDGASVLCMTGHTDFPWVANYMTTEGAKLDLNYMWTLAYMLPGGQSAQAWTAKVNTFWKPILWFVKGTYEGDWHGDVFKSDVNDNDKQHHHWGQSESGMSRLVEAFTKPGDTVCDPFLGGGTTAVVSVQLGRKFVGGDTDPEAIETTKKRLREIG